MISVYGSAMSEPLPLKDFDFCRPHELRAFEREVASTGTLDIADDAETGYMFEVDLTVPDDVHDYLNEYPLAVEKMVVTDDMLSDTTLAMKRKFGFRGPSTEKLVPNLLPKRNYILHYRNLKFYLAKGLKLERIIRGVSFTQTPWLEPYIRHNSALRQKAKNTFEKDFYKILNNACFGKTMEQVRKRSNFLLLTEPEKLQRMAAKPTCKDVIIFHDNLIGLRQMRVTVTYDKPIFAGFTVLELSKLVMAEFHYDFIKHVYPPHQTELLMTDTDSFIYQFHGMDPYQMIKDHSDRFDTSNYPVDHELYSLHNKAVLGKMKDEMSSFPIQHYVGLRPKMYALNTKGRDGYVELKKAKGVKKSATAQQLSFIRYLECLEKWSVVTTEAASLVTKLHKIYTVIQKKKGLCPYDDKRFLDADGIHTRAFGHKSDRRL